MQPLNTEQSVRDNLVSDPCACLERLKEYKHPDLLKRFAKDFGVSVSEAALLFEDTKEWLYLVSRHGELPLPIQLTIIDEVWHTFLLFNRDYDEFCKDYLGGAVHHIPEDAETIEKQTSYNLRDFVTLVYDELGEQTAIRWIRDIPRDYPPNDIEYRRFQALKRKLLADNGELPL